MSNPQFGQRPGGEPPPRRQLTPEEIKVRETFNRAEHLARNGAPTPQAQASPQTPTFDEYAVRAALNQEGLDFTYSIFPIGEKPPDAAGRNQHREARLLELENERTIIRQRMVSAEQTAADAVREVSELKVVNDTLRSELDSLKSKQQEAE